MDENTPLETHNLIHIQTSLKFFIIHIQTSLKFFKINFSNEKGEQAEKKSTPHTRTRTLNTQPLNYRRHSAPPHRHQRTTTEPPPLQYNHRTIGGCGGTVVVSLSLLPLQRVFKHYRIISICFLIWGHSVKQESENC
ncbi:hypothetical protein HanIR_Chr09g0395231 [Helianthus annuus]|nr:hypothetical protein HanIR_Chr09g0395231 [Helianthus annuus]